MASSSSENPKLEKKEEEFDLLKCSKIEQESKLDVEDLHLAGIRFDPKDDDLLMYYLVNKIFDRTLPISGHIKEIHHLPSYGPHHLPIGDFRDGKKGNEAFYFTNIQHIYSCKGKATKRSTVDGYWKQIGEEEEITYGHEDMDKGVKVKVRVGFKNALAFYRGLEPNGVKTPFVLHEYRLDPAVVPLGVLNDTLRTKIESCVVWRIINKEAGN